MVTTRKSQIPPFGEAHLQRSCSHRNPEGGFIFQRKGQSMSTSKKTTKQTKKTSKIGEPFEAVDRPENAGGTPADQEEDKRLQMDKAHGFMEDVVAYLNFQPLEARIVAVLVARLLVADVQSNLQRMGLYDGRIGDDVLADWQEEVRDALSNNLDANALASPADSAMCGLIAGLETVTG